MQKKIGWLSLSGLIVGPILGSGIILLPTTVLGVAGDWALPAWGLMVVLTLIHMSWVQAIFVLPSLTSRGTFDDVMFFGDVTHVFEDVRHVCVHSLTFFSVLAEVVPDKWLSFIQRRSL